MASKPTVKQHLAALRALFDWMIIGQVMEMNPAASVRGPKYSVRKGKTLVLSGEQTRELLDSIEDSLVGKRDRALIALMTYTFARVSAAPRVGNARSSVESNDSRVIHSTTPFSP